MPAFKDNEVTLTDSHSILIYLCEKYGKDNTHLWPTKSIERINILNKLFYSGTLLFRRDSDLMVNIDVVKCKRMYCISVIIFRFNFREES